MKAGWLIIAAAAVVAIVLLPGFLSPVIAIGDLNARTNEHGLLADGYADVTIRVFPYLASVDSPLLVRVEEAWVNETLTMPAGPVTTVLRPATIDADCLIQAELSPTGPQLDPARGASEEAPFTIGQSVDLKFGHLFLYRENTYRLHFEVYVRSCLSYEDKSLVAVFETSVKFDGSSHQLSGGDFA